MYWSVLVSIWTALITGSPLCSQISESTCPVFVPMFFLGQGGGGVILSSSGQTSSLGAQGP